jgi:branched-chain amino acid transport system permease protein
MIVAQIFVDGLVVASGYALVAAGFTLVYGLLRFVHYAHGDVAMAGAFLALAAVGAAGLGPPVALAAAVAGAAVLGIAIQGAVYRPLARLGRLAPPIAAVGVSLALESLAAIAFGVGGRTFQLPPDVVGAVRLGGVELTAVELATLAAGAIGVTALAVVLARTALGRRIRAVADDPVLAAATGIAVDRVLLAAFALASALAGLAGGLIGMQTAVTPAMGLSLALSAFAAAILGGVGNIGGAVVGAVVVGLAQSVGTWYAGDGWSDAVAVAVLTLTLLVRPRGLGGLGASTGASLPR